MKKLLMFALFIFFAVPAFAQDILWTRTYGGSDYDIGASVQQTTDGGYIVAGSTESFGAGGFDVYLIKTDSFGDTLWTRTYHNVNGGLCVQQTTDGGFIVAAIGPGPDGQAIYLIKTDSLGDTLWTRAFVEIGEGWSSSVQQTRDGGYIIGGWLGDCRIYLIKTDSLGHTLWTRTPGSSQGCIIYTGAGTVRQTTDDGYIVAAGTTALDSTGAVYLIKTDPFGDTLWRRTYGESGLDWGISVQQTTDGGYIVVGQTSSFGAGSSDVYLIKTDSLGDTLWTRTYGGSGYEEGLAVQQTTDGGYIVVGQTSSFGAGGYDVYLIKTDSLGDTLWTRTYGGSDYDMGASVQQTTDGGYIVAGSTESFGAGSFDVYLIKVGCQPTLQAGFCAEPVSGFVPLEVRFEDLSVGNPRSWFWDFGDGNTDTVQNPTHLYNDTGYFDVKLVVSNQEDTDSLIKENYIHVLPSIPLLSWSDKIGYVTDGVSPDSGLTGTLFTFRVVYSDQYNLPSQSGYPKVNIDLNGDGDFDEESEGSFTMGVADADTNYTDGREYLYNATLPASSNCQYSFSAKNSSGEDATGEPTNLKAGPVILDPATALDLYIYASDITFSDPHPDEGEEFTVYATVHNHSDSNLTNVSVSFYHSGELLNRVFVPNISAQSSATTSTQVFFATKGFYPIKVVVDEENSYQEWNELNNFAIRPIIVGDYTPSAGIVVNAQLNSPVYPYSWITVTGNAHYTPEYLGVVSGATVTITIQETGTQYTTYTNDPGNFSMGFYGPSQAGDNSVKVEVTDYTLIGDTTLVLRVIPRPGVDLAIKISLPECLSENHEDTVQAKIFNFGDQDAQNFWACIYKDASVYHCHWVDQLTAGDSLEIDTVLSFSSTGWHTLTGIVDVGDSVSEYNEGNNIDALSKFVRCNDPDITIINVVFSDHTPKGEQPLDITAWVVNKGGLAVNETLGVEFSDNGIPFDTQYIASLTPCEMETTYVISDSFVYYDTTQHSFTVFADFNNVIAECDEENNMWGGGPCIDLKIAYHDIGFSDTDPNSGDTVRITAKVYNQGNISAYNSKVRFKVDGAQIGQDVNVDRIDPGSFETAYSSTTWQVDLTPACSLLVEADPEHLIMECDESNNLGYCSLPYDLYLYYRSTCPGNYYPYVFSVCHPTVDDTLTIFAFVKNRGGLDITGQVEIEVTDNVEGPLGIITVDSVLNHESNMASGTLRHAFTEYGWHTVTLHADYNDEYYECGREDNNYYLASIFVDSLRPDLEVRSEYLEFSDDCPAWGDSLWFFVTVYNVGQGVAENVQVCILLDEVQVGEDILIDSIPVGPNNYHTDSSSVPWIAPEEFDVTHVCRVVADPNDEILEIREDNNEATRALPVVRRGDVNRDCVVNVSDVVYLINYLFIHGPAPVPLEAGDVNCNGTINAADVVYLINYLFISGPPPSC